MLKMGEGGPEESKSDEVTAGCFTHDVFGGCITGQAVECRAGLGVARGDNKIDHGDLHQRGRLAAEGVDNAGSNGFAVDVGVERFEGGEAYIYAGVEGESIEQIGEGAVVGFAFVERGEHATQAIGGRLSDEVGADEAVHGLDASAQVGEFLLGGGVGLGDDLRLRGGKRRVPSRTPAMSTVTVSANWSTGWFGNRDATAGEGERLGRRHRPGLLRTWRRSWCASGRRVGARAVYRG